jgi:predicted kinase
VLRRAVASVERGRTALLDATYLRRDARERVYAAAARAGVPCVVVDVTCPPEIVRERLRERRRRDDDPSDADVAVYEEQLATAEPLTGDETRRLVEHGAGEDPSRTLLATVERMVLDAGPRR